MDEQQISPQDLEHNRQSLENITSLVQGTAKSAPPLTSPFDPMAEVNKRHHEKDDNSIYPVWSSGHHLESL
jgi:hypothetical protein